MTKQILVNFDKNLSQSVLKRVLYCQVTLGGDAHHEEGLEGQQDVLEGVPEVGEEHDEHLGEEEEEGERINCTSAQVNFLKLRSKQKLKRHTLFQFSL